jgi:hypothetical protein
MRATEIQGRIKNSKDLDFGTVFSQSIELFKKVWVQGLVTLLLNVVLAIPILMIVYIPIIFMGLTDAFASSYDPYNEYVQSDISPVMIIVLGVLYLFIIIAMSTISFGLRAAFYRICQLRDLEQMGKEDYFYFFKKSYLGKTLKLALAFTGISVLATLLCVIPVIYAIVPLSLMIVIYAFNPDMSISDIIKLSFDLGNKKWLITFGLMFISGFLAAIVGFIMCFIGVYVTASFNYLPAYFIYKEVVGFDNESEIKKIEETSIF